MTRHEQTQNLLHEIQRLKDALDRERRRSYQRKVSRDAWKAECMRWRREQSVIAYGRRRYQRIKESR